MILNLIKKETEYDYKIEYNKYHCLVLNTLKLGHTETQLHHQHRQLDARTHTQRANQTDRQRWRLTQCTVGWRGANARG